MVTLKIRDVSFSYSSAPVLRGITLDIEKGEVIAIVGKNGAGKSTLLKCVNRILRPSTGVVYIDGLETGKMKHIERARKVGYLSQKSGQIFPTTVFDVVLLGRYPYSPFRFSRHDEDVVAGILAHMKLGHMADRNFDQLSGGEQQQVLIARALAQEADLLLFDEPTNNLDLRHQLDIMRLIRKVGSDRGITSLIAIHDLNLASSFADRIVMLHQGRIFVMGTPAEALTEESLFQAFDVRVKIYDHHGIPHLVLLESLLDNKI